MSRTAHVMIGTAATVLLLTGCQTDEPGTTGSPATTAATATTTTATAAATPTGAAPTTEDPGTTTSTAGETESATTGRPTGEATETDEPSSLPDWTSGASEQSPGEASAAQEITGVRTGLHEDYDRVVLDLSGQEPALGWFARLVDDTFEDGSGRPVEVEGVRFLELGVNGIDWTTERPERYDGATVQGQGTEVVTEVVFGVLFEGQQQIFVGLREDADYRVFSLSDPARIVVDVRHP